MPSFNFWPSSPKSDQKSPVDFQPAVPHEVQSLSQAISQASGAESSPNPAEIPLPSSPLISPSDGNNSSPTLQTPRKFLPFLYGRNASRDEHKPILTIVQDHDKKSQAYAAFSRNMIIRPVADKHAKESALIVRSLIVGPSPASPKITKAAFSGPKVAKVKSQLAQTKSANKVIAQLRALPISDAPAHLGGAHPQGETDVKTRGPIHAVCLEYPDAEMDERHFSRLDRAEDEFVSLSGVATASIDALSNMFENMHLVSLIAQPDLGLGQPGDGEGILAGAVPTAETVIKGIEQITPQLMSLGYATGRAVVPDHTGIYPPTDRISILTYWWGLEVVLPTPTLTYLSKTESITNSVINFLTALAVINNGVREVLPFVRYISQYMDFEFKSIRAQDRGQGVVCAATWIMPAALVPRPWDFPSPPPKPIADHQDQTETNQPSTDTVTTSPKPSTSDEQTLPRPSDTSDEPHVSPISAAPPVLPEVVISKNSVDSSGHLDAINAVSVA